MVRVSANCSFSCALEQLRSGGRGGRGGTLYVPRWLSPPVNLTSHLRIYLAAGAVVKADVQVFKDGKLPLIAPRCLLAARHGENVVPEPEAHTLHRREHHHHERRRAQRQLVDTQLAPLPGIMKALLYDPADSEEAAGEGGRAEAAAAAGSGEATREGGLQRRDEGQGARRR